MAGCPRGFSNPFGVREDLGEDALLKIWISYSYLVYEDNVDLVGKKITPSSNKKKYPIQNDISMKKLGIYPLKICSLAIVTVEKWIQKYVLY